MDKIFRRWTAGAVIAAIICLYAVWWAGSTNGADDLCKVLGIQSAPYCLDNSSAHVWCLLVALASLAYLVLYITRVHRMLISRRTDGHQPTDRDPSPPETTEHDKPHQARTP
jgi:hypothetical protein